MSACAVAGSISAARCLAARGDLAALTQGRRGALVNGSSLRFSRRLHKVQTPIQSDDARLEAAWRDLEQSRAAETRTNRALASRIAALDSSVQVRKQVDPEADLATKQATRDDLKLKPSMLERELAAGVYE
jgi:hypothetical protein